MSFYNVSLSYLERSHRFTGGSIFKHLKAVHLKCFEQAIILLNFNTMCAAFDYYEKLCMCKDLLVKIGNRNISGFRVSEVVA
jgi:hypothetical protein